MKPKYIIFLMLTLSSNGLAQLSPGGLHKSHAHLEGLQNCSKCHQFEKKISAQTCLACHTLLKERIATQKGLHANNEHRDCENCHVEHHGRNYELVYWPEGKENFKHQAAGYPLEGKHAQLKCAECHQAKNIADKALFIEKKKDLNRTLLGLSTECLSCHRDAHRSQLNSSCLNCHEMTGWKPASKFNHGQTKYTLTGRHQQIACEKCHLRIVDNKFEGGSSFSRYKEIAFANCTDCHRDAHHNQLGQNCESCHSTSGWKNVNRQQFDHNRTAYPLKGKHAGVKCEGCHLPGEPLKIQKFGKCADCHTDYHLGQFKTPDFIAQCEKCHSENGFTPASFTIEQHNRLKFPLEGGHLAVPCIVCHKKINPGRPNETVQFHYSSTRCLACHADPHGGQVDKFARQNGCEACHQVSSWFRITFDHARTNFPLKGQHQTIACGACHTKENPGTKKSYTFLNVSTECHSCHEDTHFGQFREKQKKHGKSFTECGRCHTPVDWLAEKFDHNTFSSFKLNGGHQFVKCENCHKLITLKGKTFRLYKPLRTECSACHDTRKKEFEKIKN